jgi:enterochelin esterase-like enzyme
MPRFPLALFLLIFSSINVMAQKEAPFKWVNPIPEKFKLQNLHHATFKSPSMGTEVGYCIYLPTAYTQETSKKFPVVYYLHGGRPGSESKSLGLVKYIDDAMKKGLIPPIIYVFVNGGPVSHYNLPERKDSMGEDVFIKELIPHIDSTYRTLADRLSRGLEGFSQGGRGTARIMFKYPELFSSVSPGGGGYSTEKSISENKGKENENLIFAEGYNTWDLARQYSKDQTYRLNILFHVGTKCFNYENNLEYMAFLKALNIPFEKVIVEGATHSAKEIYEARGLEILQFHGKQLKRD